MTKSTNFNYYEADNVYGALFFQFPKVLMYGEQYKHLSSDAKLAYMVLKDRLEYSLRNNWVDEEGHVYFTFTNQELENLFNCHNQKVVKIKHTNLKMDCNSTELQFIFFIYYGEEDEIKMP